SRPLRFWGVVLLVLAAGCAADEPDSTVVINEVAPKALSGSDWVEVYNTADEPADVSGFGLVDSKSGRLAWRFPAGTIIGPYGYYVVRRDEDQVYDPAGFTFGLGAADTVTLKDTEDRVVDEVAWGEELAEGRTLGRLPDGGSMTTLSEGTPGLPNTVAECVGCSAGAVSGPSSRNADMYTELTVVDYALTVTDADLAALFAAREKLERLWIPCRFTFGGETYDGADVRLKGSPEDWGGDGYQDQFVIRFNGRVEGGRFRGLRRLNLDAQKADPSRIRNNIGMFVMRRAGLKAPRANHVRLTINGKLYGLYENIEVIDKEFVEDRYSNADANLYDGPELVTNETVGDTSRFEAMVETSLAPCTDPAQYAAALSQMVDLPTLLTQLAAEAAIASPKNFWADGFEPLVGAFGAWNFYLYDDPAEGFVLMPWDLDAVLNPAFTAVDASVYTFTDGESTTDGSVPWTCLQRHDTSRALFLGVLSRLRQEVMSELPAVVDRYCGLIRSDIAADPNYSRSMSEFDAACSDIKVFAAARATYLDSVIAAK
ncbi:MAG: hypothetical protein ACI9OJ_002121, partial [Myxococcota bacterium]